MRIVLLTAVVAVAGLGLAQAALAQQAAAPDRVAVYDVFETPVPAADVPENPYDPEQVSLTAELTAPSGKRTSAPGFFRVEQEVVTTPAAERLRGMRLLKVYLSKGGWVGGDSIAYIVDDVRLVKKDGTEVVLGDFEAEDPRWFGTGVPGAIQDEIVHSGSGAFRADLPVESHGRWPGISMDLKGQDWSDCKELRFAFYPLTNHTGGTLSVEFYAGENDKLSRSFRAGGDGLKLNEWNDVAWDLTAIGDRKESRPAGEGGFAVRFCPTEVGRHSYVVRRDGTEGSLLEGAFEATPSERPGLLRVGPAGASLLSFENGRPMALVGENMCWFGPGGLDDYDRWLTRLAAVGGNYVRLWMAPWCFGIEWQELGRYQQDRAQELDYVFRRARELGIYIMLCLDYHGFLRADGSWGASPYSAGRGGPCQKPPEFLTSEAARASYKNRLRYLVARYAAYDNLLSWEFWNEVELIDSYDSDAVARWHAEMAGYLRGLDPYRHIITTSYAGMSGDEKVWSLPEIEYTQGHTYAGTDKVEVIVAAAREHRSKYNKPFLVGEFGVGGGGGESESRDQDGLYVHNGAWGGLMAGTMGTAMTWWWDGYVERGDMYRHWAPIARFATDVAADAQPIADERFEAAYAGTQAPALYDDVEVEGRGASWQEAEFNKPVTLAVPRDGPLPDLGTLARVLHGVRNHPTLHNPVTFELDREVAGRFVAQVHGVSGQGGAGLVISVDGEPVLERDFVDEDDTTTTRSDYNGLYAVDVPVGKHTVTVENPGNDWLLISYIMEGYRRLDRPSYRVLGVERDGRGWLWLQNRQSTWGRQNRKQQDPMPIPASVLTVAGVPEGEYEVEWWDTWKGEVASRATVRAEQGRLRLAVPAFERDVACKIRPR